MAFRMPSLGLRRALHTSAFRAEATPPPPLPSTSAAAPPPPPTTARPGASSLRPDAAKSSSRITAMVTPAPPPPLERPPHLPDLPSKVQPLNRPLGVPDVPIPREFGFWELMMPVGNDEFRKAKMQAIMKEFARSNLGNIMESWRTGGKGWIAPKSIYREDKALYLPNFSGITPSSDRVKKHTSNLCKGKISVVALAGTQFAYNQVLKFVDPIERRLEDRADFQIAHVSFQSTKLKAYLSSFFAPQLRKIVPKSRWERYIISTQDLKSTLEDQCLGISNNLAGYVYLVDENLKVRWAACGDPMPEELDSLLVASTQLLDRLDKTKGQQNLSDLGKTAADQPAAAEPVAEKEAGAA